MKFYHRLTDTINYRRTTGSSFTSATSQSTTGYLHIPSTVFTAAKMVRNDADIQRFQTNIRGIVSGLKDMADTLAYHNQQRSEAYSAKIPSLSLFKATTQQEESIIMRMQEPWKQMALLGLLRVT